MIDTKEFIIRMNNGCKELIMNEMELNQCDSRFSVGNYGTLTKQIANTILSCLNENLSIKDNLKGMCAKLQKINNELSSNWYCFLNSLSNEIKQEPITLNKLKTIINNSIEVYYRFVKLNPEDKNIITSFKEIVETINQCNDSTDNLLFLMSAASLKATEQSKLMQAFTGNEAMYGKSTIGYENISCLMVSYFLSGFSRKEELKD